jgi:hypothetical protein
MGEASRDQCPAQGDIIMSHIYIYIYNFKICHHWRVQTVSEKWKSFHTETVFNKTVK